MEKMIVGGKLHRKKHTKKDLLEENIVVLGKNVQLNGVNANLEVTQLLDMEKEENMHLKQLEMEYLVQTAFLEILTMEL